MAFAEHYLRFLRIASLCLITAMLSVHAAAAQSVGARFQRRFHECDSEDTCDGRKLKHGCANDRSHNTALLRFSDGTVFFDAKMGLDADGSPYAKNTPGSTDSPD